MPSIPFIMNYNGTSGQIPALQGRVTRIRSVYLSIGPASAVTGIATFLIQGLAQQDQQSGGAFGVPGQLQISFLPSTTDVVNTPIDLGVPIPSATVGDSVPLTFEIQPNGSDTLDSCLVTVIGDLAPAEIVISP